MAIVYGTTAGPSPSYFQTRIEYSYHDLGNGYYRLQYRRWVTVTAGDFYGTNLSTSWAGNVYIYGVGDYAISGWSSVDVRYGSSTTISASANYTGTSYYESSASYSFVAPTPTYTISYNANGGSGAPSKQTKTYGKTLTLSKAIPTRVGYNFLGWSTNKGATKPTYKAGGSYTSNASVTLYAVWERIVFNIVFDASTNGGTVEGQNKIVINRYYGDAIGGEEHKLPVAVRRNYEFLGWNTESNGSGLYVSYDTKVFDNDRVYAIFKLQANCYIKKNSEYVAGMMYQKVNGTYQTGVVNIKKDGAYKESNM
jgi:uncharacterized repeat protein (TIGR02543 family)